MKAAIPSLLICLLSICQGFSQNCDSLLEAQFNQAYTFLGQSTVIKDSIEANETLKKAREEFLQLANINCDPDAPSDPENLRGEQVYQGAMTMIALLISPQFYPLLNRQLLYNYAIELLQLSRKIYLQRPKTTKGDYLIFRTYINEGKTHAMFRDQQKAEEQLEKGLLISRQHRGEGEDRKFRMYKADLLREIGEYKSNAGDYFEALNYFFQAMDIYQAIGDSLYHAGCLYNISEIYLHTADFHSCIEYADKVMAFQDDLQNDNTYRSALMDVYRFSIYSHGQLGNISQAEKGMKELLALPFLDDRTEAEAYGIQGVVYLENESYPLAIANLRRSVELYQKLNTQQLDVLGALLKKYESMGRYFRETNQLDSSSYYYQKAWKQTGLLDNGPLKVSQLDVAKLLAGEGATILKKFGQKADTLCLNEAEILFGKALSLIDDQKREFKDEDTKLFLAKEGQQIYEDAIKLSLLQGRFEEAFQLSEQAKANLLFASLRDEVARKASNLSKEYLDKEYELKRQIALFNQRLRGLTEENPLYNPIMVSRSKAKANLNSLIEEIEELDPAYYALKYRGEKVNLADLQKSLPENTSLIEYFAGESYWYIFLVNKTEVEPYVLPRSSREIIEFSSLMSEADGMKEKREYIEEKAYSIYQQVLGPLEKKLGQYLVIIPDAELNYLPFDVLFSKPAEPNSFASTYPYLVKEKAISYNFSAKLWQTNLQNQSKASLFARSLLVFAPNFDPISSEELSQTEISMMQNPLIYQRPEIKALPQLANMSSSQEEAQRLAGIPGTKVFSPQNGYAILGRFLLDAGNYRFLHLATHAKFDSSNHRYSYLAFRPVDNGVDDERLYLDDLYRLRLQNEMVVLSACETQLGEFLPGEGNASLAQGFTHAGVKSILATRWSINSEAKAQQMALFYDFLRKGHNKAEALRLAKVEILSQGSKYPSPYYWAAPVLMGDTIEVSFFTLRSWYGWALVGLALLVFFGMVFVRLRKSS